MVSGSGFGVIVAAVVASITAPGSTNTTQNAARSVLIQNLVRIEVAALLDIYSSNIHRRLDFMG
jgi:gas vesicle protein